MSADILTNIQNDIHAFSKGQKKIAAYILSNYDKAAFMTASRLGKTVEVSESTVVRFAATSSPASSASRSQATSSAIRTWSRAFCSATPTPSA